MADEAQGLPPSRFLELLNKASRTPEEEAELQTELKRQADEKTKEEQATTQDVPATPVQPEVPVEQPAPSVEPEAPVTPTEIPPVEPAQPNDQEEKPYDLTQLTDEIGTAVGFLESQNKTLAVEMAKSSLTQAAYWTKLASQGQ